MKMKNINLTAKVLIASAVLMTITACGVKDKTEKNADQKVTILADERMTSDELANAGEQLVTPYTFMLADKVFTQALEKDPTNLKAQFYKSFLKRFMVFKGIAKRVSLIEKRTNSSDPADNRILIKNLSTMPNSALKQFLLDGKEDINTVSEMQNLISDYESALADFYSFLRKNADAEISLNMNPYIFEQNIKSEWGKSCVVVNQDAQNYKVECDASDAATKKVNSADLMALRQIVGYESTLWAIYNSYSLEGFEKIAELAEKNAKELTADEKVKLIRKYENLGKLRSRARISIIKDNLVDMVAAARWVAQYQDRLCPKGENIENQRSGYLFSNGLCIALDAQRKMEIDKADKMLNGAVEGESFTTVDGSKAAVVVDVMAWSRKAPADLKSVLLPTNQNIVCGEKLEFADKTMGGIYPNGDMIDKLNPTGPCQ